MNDLKVCKFGGSSVASSSQIKIVADIIRKDKNRKIVVVSAPKGITDNLIACVNAYFEKNTFPQKEFDKIKVIYDEIGTNLNIKKITDDLLFELKYRIKQKISDKKEYADRIKAWGEYSNAKLISAYFNKAGVPSIFLAPEDVGFYVTEDFGNARLLNESYENIKKSMKTNKVVLFPGFYGKTKNGKDATFSRGGSDLTGSILAAATSAKIYENWTDQNGIRKADPRIVNKPEKIDEITYKEIRELAYMGFKIFHAEAMIPAMKAKIPINIKNTNNPKEKGTLIVNERKIKKSEPIIGIASRNNFAVFNIEKILMDQQIGFGRRLLKIFEERGISYEHTPSGIDSISVILDASQLTPKITQEIIADIKQTLSPESVSVEFNKCLISIVGIVLKRTPGIVARITGAIAKSKVTIEILNQGASEISTIIGIDQKDSAKAVNAIYKEFFR